MANALELDHTVINVRFAMDRAAPMFEALGFTLTPRGYHSLGSINHLMMFGTDYFELIGLPVGTDTDRPDISESPDGINGLVFKTADVDETFAHLKTLDMDGAAPHAFSRPVKLADGEFPAKFRTVTARPGTFPGGRVYFCEHGTPELVWRPEWQSHRNQATAMSDFVVASTTPEAEATRFSQLTHGQLSSVGDGHFEIALAKSRITVLSVDRYGERFGALASAMADRPSIFGALTFTTTSLAGVRAIAEALPASMPSTIEDNRVVIRVSDFDSVLEFVE